MLFLLHLLIAGCGIRTLSAVAVAIFHVGFTIPSRVIVTEQSIDQIIRYLLLYLHPPPPKKRRRKKKRPAWTQVPESAGSHPQTPVPAWLPDRSHVIPNPFDFRSIGCLQIISGIRRHFTTGAQLHPLPTSPWINNKVIMILVNSNGRFGQRPPGNVVPMFNQIPYLTMKTQWGWRASRTKWLSFFSRKIDNKAFLGSIQCRAFNWKNPMSRPQEQYIWQNV